VPPVGQGKDLDRKSEGRKSPPAKIQPLEAPHAAPGEVAREDREPDRAEEEDHADSIAGAEAFSRGVRFESSGR